MGVRFEGETLAVGGEFSPTFMVKQTGCIAFARFLKSWLLWMSFSSKFDVKSVEKYSSNSAYLY